jgi:hypothetical protein
MKLAVIVDLIHKELSPLGFGLTSQSSLSTPIVMPPSAKVNTQEYRNLGQLYQSWMIFFDPATIHDIIVPEVNSAFPSIGCL